MPSQPARPTCATLAPTAASSMAAAARRPFGAGCTHRLSRRRCTYEARAPPLAMTAAAPPQSPSGHSSPSTCACSSVRARALSHSRARTRARARAPPLPSRGLLSLNACARVRLWGLSRWHRQWRRRRVRAVQGQRGVDRQPREGGHPHPTGRVAAVVFVECLGLTCTRRLRDDVHGVRHVPRLCLRHHPPRGTHGADLPAERGVRDVRALCGRQAVLRLPDRLLREYSVPRLVCHNAQARGWWGAPIWMGVFATFVMVAVCRRVIPAGKTEVPLVLFTR